jgi:peptidoglycan/LPS O-acetylase OafA/YrhL
MRTTEDDEHEPAPCAAAEVPAPNLRERRPHWFTLADGLARRHDNFLLLRFLAAALVIYGHGYALTVHAPGVVDLFTRLHWRNYSGTIGVDLFFVISGFLVTGSYLRRRNLFAFVWARTLRLVPAYAVCMLLSALVLGAAYTQLPLADYLQHPDTRGYVLTNLKFGVNLQWNLPGVFTDNPRSATVNGSIWTLPAEVRMYVWLAIVGVLGLLSRRSLATLTILGLLLAGWLAPQQIPLLPIASFLHLGAMFALGVLCYVHRDWLPASGFVVAALAAACWMLHATVLYPVAFALAEAAFAFWFAYRLSLPSLDRFGDASYGLYLWGFPVQQMVAHQFPAGTPLMNAALSLPFAAALGFLSWHLVEKPTLSAKEWPQRIARKHFGRRTA